MYERESVNKYGDHVLYLENRLNDMGESKWEEDRLKTMFRGLSNRLEGTRNLIREIGRSFRRVVHMVFAEEEEMNAGS